MADPSPDPPEFQLGLDLTESHSAWPPHERFPYNFGGLRVGDRLVEDLAADRAPLVITGYASLDRILGLLGAIGSSTGGEGGAIRVLFGVEPVVPESSGKRAMDAPQEIIDYWLERGVSLLHCREVLDTRELLNQGRLAVRTSDGPRVHAKIFVAESAVTLGSSNYTGPGLERNIEANVRFTSRGDAERYEQARALGEAIWRLGADFSDGFRDLLDQLIQNVGWREALARACAELLEGPWAARGHSAEATGVPTLWPAQDQGIAQALWVLENVGSVLIADATGSGKTRMGAHLLRALQDRNWITGRSRGRMPVLICPPILKAPWREELVEAEETVHVFSHGLLSQRGSVRRREIEATLRQTEVLAVDEVHNFLNRASARSRLLYGNVADHVILVTATPINRGAPDLLALVELLGADNFDEDVLDVLGGLARRRRKGGRGTLSESESSTVRQALQQFVVRRTKDDFNTLIDLEPDRYLNALGELCRFPVHRSVVFDRKEPQADRSYAAAIREKAKNLRGLVNLRKTLRLPAAWRWQGWDDAKALTVRQAAARALAAYQIRSRLRSSRVALVEHIVGTEAAEARFGLEGMKGSHSGDVLSTLEQIRGKPPKSALETELPDWLADPGAHAQAVDEEIATYKDILRMAEMMSDHRQDENARYLLDLQGRHDQLLAFDSHLISLYDLDRRLRDQGARRVVVATGEQSLSARRRFGESFALGSGEHGVIGLCSDALAEGLNLQGASAVVHLDLPSVIRVLEQRIGRVDRMDTSHSTIEVHWPDEPREFSLGSDERLFWRLREVEELLGSNVPVPEELAGSPLAADEAIPIEDIIEAVESGEAVPERVTLADAFAQVRGLVRGAEALIDPPVYEALRRSRARVLSSVAVVSSATPWVFLAIGASDRTAARWVFIDLTAEGPGAITVSIEAVAAMLRSRLTRASEDIAFDDSATAYLDTALHRLRNHERFLLPRRKQRALDEMTHVLKRYEREARESGDAERLSVVGRILRHQQRGETVDSGRDLGQLADWWLQLIRPEWYAYLVQPNVPRPARLKGLRGRLKREPIATERLASVDEVAFSGVPLDRRVVAALVGVGAREAVTR